MELHAGDIVISMAGRDKGRPFVVMQVVDGQYVLLCDGDLRKVDKPKRKKIKHLKSTDTAAQLVKEKLASGVRVTNPDLRRCLEEVDSKASEGGRD